MRGEDRAVGFGERPPNRFRGARRAHDRTKILRRPRAAGAFERVERGADLVESGQGKASVADLEPGGLRRLGEESGNAGFFEGGNQRQNRRPSGRRSSQSGYEPEDDAELERIEVGAVSVSRGYGVARRSSESLRSIFLRA